MISYVKSQQRRRDKNRYKDTTSKKLLLYKIYEVSQDIPKCEEGEADKKTQSSTNVSNQGCEIVGKYLIVRVNTGKLIAPPCSVILKGMDLIFYSDCNRAIVDLETIMFLAWHLYFLLVHNLNNFNVYYTL